MESRDEGSSLEEIETKQYLKTTRLSPQLKSSLLAESPTHRSKNYETMEQLLKVLTKTGILFFNSRGTR